MSDELKACPFCNSVPMVKQYFIKGVANHINYFVECPCGNRTRSRKSYYGAVSEWNTRPREDALQARITELKETIEDIKELAELASVDAKTLQSALFHLSTIGIIANKAVKESENE